MSKETEGQVPTLQVISEELSTFIDRLAEDIVLDDDISTCAMCAIGSCDQQVSGLVCLNAVKAWLLAKAGEYLTHNLKEAS